METMLNNLGMLLPFLDNGCSVMAVTVCMCKNYAYNIYVVAFFRELLYSLGLDVSRKSIFSSFARCRTLTTFCKPLLSSLLIENQISAIKA